MTYTRAISINMFAATHASASLIGESVVVHMGDPIGYPHDLALFFDDLDEARRVLTMALSSLEMLHREANDAVSVD